MLVLLLLNFTGPDLEIFIIALELRTLLRVKASALSRTIVDLSYKEASPCMGNRACTSIFTKKAQYYEELQWFCFHTEMI